MTNVVSLNHFPSDIYFSKIVHSHIEALPDSSLSLMGKKMVEIYYRSVLASPYETLFVAGEQSLDGVAVLSLQPHNLMKRLVVDNLVNFNFYSSALSSITPLLKIISSALHETKELPAIHDLPEVVQLFTLKEKQGTGVGTSLLNHVEDFLKEKGIGGYFVKTLTDPANPALTFYRNRGFIVVGNCVMNGQNFSFCTKRLMPQKR